MSETGWTEWRTFDLPRQSQELYSGEHKNEVEGTIYYDIYFNESSKLRSAPAINVYQVDLFIITIQAYKRVKVTLQTMFLKMNKCVKKLENLQKLMRNPIKGIDKILNLAIKYAMDIRVVILPLL